MSLLISDAWAQNPAPAQPGSEPMVTLLMLGVMFVAFYFLLIRPQTKRAKEHKAMVSALAKGDEVIAAGGLLGRVTRLDENFITLEIAEGVEIRVQRQAVQTILPKGTLKAG